MEQVALHHYLNEIATIKDELRKIEFTRQESLGLLMQLLCFIMEKSLLEQSCTMKDMESFVVYLMNKQGMDGRNINSNDLVNYLLIKALQNNGKPYYFDYYSFEKEKMESLHIRLIEDKMIQVEGIDSFSYSLTAQGYQFLFSTLEVEEALQMDFEQLKLKYAIQKKNFASARESVDNLFTLNRKQIQKIREYILQIKEDIGLFTTETYENTYKSTFETLGQQQKKHEEVYKLITSAKDKYIEQNMDNKNLEMEEDLNNIDYIRRRLQQLLGEQIKLFNEQQTLGEVYDEAITNVLYIGFENRLNIEKDILEVFESNVKSLDGMAKILKPLLMPKIKRTFNFSKAYSNQRIESFDTELTDEAMYLEEVVDEESEKLFEERIAFVQSIYESIVTRILSGMIHGSSFEVKLSEIFDTVEDVELLRTVLIQLHGDQNLDIRSVYKQTSEHGYTPREDFDFGYTYSSICEKNKEVKSIKSIETKVLRDRKITIINCEREVLTL